VFPGSGYIDFHDNNILILSSRGILGYSINEEDKFYFKQIRNNIDEFISLNQFKKKSTKEQSSKPHHWFS